MSSPRPQALALLLFAACTDVGPPLPELTSVTPAVSPAGQQVTLTIDGTHLTPRFSTDFSRGSGERTADVTLALRSPGRELPLEVLTHDSTTRIVAQLAAGAAPGRYDLVLTDAWGRTAELPRALWLLGPCESLTGPNPGDPCDGADSDACLDDAYVCDGTTLVCPAGGDNPELCDGLDNDCDPLTADGAAETTLGQACDGPDSDLCTDDRLECSGGGLACAGGTDTPDLCDGLDDDCDPGTPDGAGDPDLGAGCDGPDLDLCQDDLRVCTGGTLTCAAGGNNVDACDGVDNDCDPSTADGASDPAVGLPCDGPDLDSCLDGTRVCAGGALGCSEAAEDACGIVAKVGTFLKTTAGAPATQTFAHGLGVVPQALILFSSGASTADGRDLSHQLSVGFVDQDRTQRVRAAASEDGLGVSSASRRFADAAVSFLRGSGTLESEAQVTAWDASTVTLRWATNDAAARKIHFLALGGGPSRSKLVDWQMATATGPQPLAGLGFSPTALLHAHSGTEMTSTTTLSAGILAVAGNDSSLGQWVSSFVTADGADPANARRAQRTDRTLFTYSTAGTVYKEATLQSLDPDGFTLNYSAAPGTNGLVTTLALGGLRTKAFCFNKPPSPGPQDQAVTGIGFRPLAVILSSFQRDATTAIASGSALGLGAADGASTASASVSDWDGDTFTWVARADRPSFFHEVQWDQSISAEANLVSFDADGFTLGWITNDNLVSEICGLAFGAP